MKRPFRKYAGLLTLATLIAWMPLQAHSAANQLVTLGYESNMEFSAASRFTSFNGEVFFVETDPVHGAELWKTDGTVSGTQLVKDILPGAGSSSPNHLTVVNGALYFVAMTNAAGHELWKTDGTPEGTLMVKDIQPGTGPSSPQNLTVANGMLYFTAASDFGQPELWKSDGTADGTVQVNTAGDAANMTSISNLTAVGTDIFFIARTPETGSELWVTDGTPEGTRLVMELKPGPDNGSPLYLTNLNGTLVFSGSRVGEGYELWKSDGTEAGTVMVKDINAGAYGSSPMYLTAVGGTLFFSANDETHGRELWKSDGTTAGTVLVKDVQTGSGTYGGYSSSPGGLQAVGSTLFFFASMSPDGTRLWKTNGTTAGTTMVANDFGAGTESVSPGNITGSATYLYFVTHVAGTGWVQWRVNTSGNAINLPGTVGITGTTHGLTPVGSKLYGRAYSSAGDNWTLWVTDGTPGGTIELHDPQPRIETAGVWMNGDYYFTRYSATHGTELWASDGTPTGTRLVKDINVGTASSSPTNFFAAGNTLYFAATTVDEGHELWRTDGTDSGTQLVKDINSDAGSSGPMPFAQLDNAVFFSARDAAAGVELWKTDGTSAGTILVKNIGPDASSSSPNGGVAFNGAVYFSANNGTDGDELWKSDGTEAGTMMLEINPETDARPAPANPREFVVFNNEVWFQAYVTGSGAELWKTDGTVDGTVMVKDIRAGYGSSSPTYLTVAENTLYFRAVDNSAGYELWKSDGTVDGTTLVKDIFPGGHSSQVESLVAAGNVACFAAQDNTASRNVWCSDGTEAGTLKLADIASGVTGSDPQTLIVAGDTLFFSASNESENTEIWQSDGTLAGTTIVSLAAGTDTVGPLLRVAGGDGNVFFDTYDENGVSALNVLPNNPPAFVGTPSVTGESLVGSVLNVLAAATDPDVSNTVTLGYQWKANGSAITKADAIAYLLTPNETGKHVTVDITARDNLGATTTLTNVGGLDIYAALELIGSGGVPLPDSVSLADGESATFTVSGGEGSSYTVMATPNVNGVSGVISDLGSNEYRFDAPSTGAFAGDYSITIRDVATGGEWTMDVSVPLRTETTRSVLLGGMEEGELTVSGGVGGSTFNFEIMLPSADGVSPDVADMHGDVATVEASATAANDATNGNPASVTFTPATVATTSEFTVVADNGVVQGESDALLAQAPITFAGTVRGTGGEAINATVTLQAADGAGVASDVTNEVGNTWQTATSDEGAFSLIAPVAEDADAANARMLQVVADGYAALTAPAANCHSATPCELVMEYETAAADPVLDPAGGTFTDEVEVTITSTTVDAVLYYTLNGDEPSTGNGTEIASGESLLLTESATLKVIATKAMLSESAVVSADYVIEASETSDDGDGGAPASGGGGALAWLLLLALLPRAMLRKTR